MASVREPQELRGALQAGDLVRGKKTGLAGDAITCHFVSRWDAPGEEEDISVVGPMTMVRVSR